MKRLLSILRLPSAATVFAVAAVLAGAPVPSRAQAVTLSGAEEVPPVQTSAKGDGRFTVAPDMTITGKVTTSGVAGTAAHIHEGAPGTNGKVTIPLTKTGENEWSVPPATKMSDAQHKAYQAGSLYVNVHSAANPNGEIRGQLKP